METICFWQCAIHSLKMEFSKRPKLVFIVSDIALIRGVISSLKPLTICPFIAHDNNMGSCNSVIIITLIAEVILTSVVIEITVITAGLVRHCLL